MKKPSILPNLLVLAALAAVGWWGHSTGWKAGKPSELWGGGPAPAEDWCALHNVPDSRCVACHPELVGEDPAGWCREHGVPESHCTVCHPDLLVTGVAGDWCEEHGVPESGCTLCHPDLGVVGGPGPASEVAVSPGAHESESAEDHPDLGVQRPPTPFRDPRTCQKHAARVQFASPAAIGKAGIGLGTVVERPMSDSVHMTGEVDYDRTRFARLSPRVTGVAAQVLVELGAAVRAGDVLALVDAPEAARARAEWLTASAAQELAAGTAARVQASAAAGFRTEAERLETEAAARAAEIRALAATQTLASLGLSEPKEGETGLVPILAPFDGVVVTRDVVLGERLDETSVAFEVADTRRMGVTLHVPLADAHRIALGQQVLFRLDDARDEAVTGEVAWISTAVDEVTRTLEVRADVENPDGALRARAFGHAQIVVRTSPSAVAVPSEAVQWEGCCYVVFVRVADDLFQTRKVRLGARDAAYTEIHVGLLPGEVVATAGSHVLKSEILKSSLGAGCTDE